MNELFSENRDDIDELREHGGFILVPIEKDSDGYCNLRYFLEEEGYYHYYQKKIEGD